MLSPFGYGEICWRDFEAIAAGCVLVKPSMAHLETAPDIFEPFVTYVPVAWDWSDLEAAIEYVLLDPGRASELRSVAKRRLDAYLNAPAVARRFAEIIDEL